MVQLLPIKTELTGARPYFIQREFTKQLLSLLLFYTQRNNNLCSFAAWPINQKQSTLVTRGFCEL